MLISEFDYDLPTELIAQQPLAERCASRMLVVDRASDAFLDRQFTDMPDLLLGSDVLVLNNTKVFPARLFGRTETGANVEVFLVRARDDGNWEVLARPAKRLRTGKTIIFGDDLTAVVANKDEDGKVVLELTAKGELYETLDRIGKTPLPPYIKREASSADTDRDRYQTVFASERGAIAAPTAGLHFTPEILEKLKAKGVTVAQLTLHVGYGTFEPVRVEDLQNHKVSAESYQIDADTVQTLNEAKGAGRRIVAVGTTTTRALEHNIDRFGTYTAGQHIADLTITPGREFKAIDALLTNFHLPKSSLLVLVSTFAGRELIMRAYKHAVAERYRFYSYGDCMLIV
jgi:S-adenosylmethionine:tRNA ribosyltransferase-isomerase